MTEIYGGTGRRKSSVARVRMRPGTGKILVNRREIKDYFPSPRETMRVLAPLKATSSETRYDIVITVKGGGFTGQSGAIALGVARALMKANPETEPILRDAHFVTRDARGKERKKYGRRGARRGFQFSKR
ncbi:MAG: 30S ribosomal protein S9 [Planctomycetes bacterium]|nr:30S ribosomal protein S9 [Planctomycetota bacterium]